MRIAQLGFVCAGLMVGIAQAEQKEAGSFTVLAKAACAPNTENDFLYFVSTDFRVCWRLIKVGKVTYRLEYERKAGLLTLGTRTTTNPQWVVVDSRERVVEGYTMAGRDGTVVYTMSFRGCAKNEPRGTCERSIMEWETFYRTVADRLCAHLNLSC